MELRRADGNSFEVESARRVVEAMRLSLSFAAGRWVAPALFVGFNAAGGEAWRWWVRPICAPYERIGSLVISPMVVGDLEAFLKASVAKLRDAEAANTTRFQMQLATQTSNWARRESDLLRLPCDREPELGDFRARRSGLQGGV
jgi:hypothetical protein